MFLLFYEEYYKYFINFSLFVFYIYKVIDILLGIEYRFFRGMLKVKVVEKYF